MEQFTVELIVANHCGTLNRITELYAKHKYNIDQVTANETADPELSLIRIVSRGNVSVQSQMTRQLSKLYDVKNVVLLDNSMR